MTVHEHVQQTLSAMRDRQADPDQRFLAERHLQRCATCRAVAEAFAGVDTLAQEVLLPSGPPPFEAALGPAGRRAGPRPAPPAARCGAGCGWPGWPPCWRCWRW